MRQIEEIMGRRQIQAIIAADSISVILYRSPKISDGAGGFKLGPPVPLEPQTAALIPFKRRMTEFLVNTEMGDVPDLPFVLLGMPTLNVERGDTFTWLGDHFKVETIDIKTNVRVAAHVDYFGGTHNG